MSWNTGGPQKVLGLHGWLDNAATFNKLVPLLPSSYHFVSFDLPGHGLSSHLPHGSTLHLIDFAYAAKRVVDYLQWEPGYSAVAHSMGYIVAYLLDGMFPDEIDKLVGMDKMNTLPASSEELAEIRKTCLLTSMAHEKMSQAQAEVKAHSWDRLVTALSNSIMGGMDPESAKILLSRSVTKVGDDAYVLNRDWRYREYRGFLFLTEEEHKAYAEAVTADVLFFHFKQGLRHVHGDGPFQYYPKNAKSFKEIKVEGKHHTHLDNPGSIAPHIIKFMEKS